MRVKDIDFVGVGWEWLSGKGRRKEWKLGCMAVASNVVWTREGRKWLPCCFERTISMEETAGVSLRAASYSG